VLAVIGYHAAPGFAPGGYVGVDVFFVISGYLISSILFEQSEAGTFSLADFYARRIRRIFPALIVVLLACWAIGWYVLLSDEYFDLQKHLAAGATFLSNFLLWQDAGYFDAPSGAKPLLHLWSLGIEEQFYLIWPPILYLCWKRRWNVLAVTAAIIAVSFVSNVAVVGRHSAVAFYWPTSRMWELLTGAALAYVIRLRGNHADRAASQWSWVGLACIAIAVATFGTLRARFPGWWAVLPVAGTTAVIAAGTNGWLNRFLLARRPLVQLGLISYPLYLWHWPLLSFIAITESGHPSARLKTLAVLTSFALAWATYQWVEQPARRGMSVRTPGRIAALACTLLLVAGVSLVSSETERFGPRTPLFAANVPPRLRSPEPDPDCRARFPTSASLCEEYAPSMKLTTALIGDSHAQHFLNGVGANLAARGEDVVLLGETGCPPLLDLETIEPGSTPKCAAANKSVLEFVGSSRRIQRIILSFRGATEMTMPYQLVGTSLTPEESMPRALNRTVDYLASTGKEVWLFLQVPEVDFDIRECLRRPFSFEATPPAACGVSRSAVLSAQARFRQVVDDLKHRQPSLRVFDPVLFLCDDGWCPAIKGSRVMYVDRHHLTRAGSLFFADKFRFD
jgi:peptidoglycan/LPS O-acetylase OafA/YrhL